MTLGQPPSTKPPMNVRAAGTESHAVGSSVPCQSNSSRKRDRGADRGVGAVGDRARADTRLPIAPRVEEGRTLGRADPLVKVAGVPGGTEPVEVEREHARCVSAVHERVDPLLRQRRDQPFDRHDEGRRTRDVAEDGDACAGGRRREDALGDIVGGRARERQAGDYDAGTVTLRNEAEDVEDRVVLVVCRENLVAGVE